jgi:Protein of unknown function (DUF2510)
VTDQTPTGPAVPKKTVARKRPTTAAAASPNTEVPADVAAEVVVAVQPPAAPVAPLPVAATAPAGWYPVSAGSAQQRWWDGTSWTEHVHDPALVVAPAVPQVPVATPVPKAPEGTKPGTVWFWLLAIGVPVLQILELIPAAIFYNQLINNDSDVSSLVSAEFSPAYLVVLLAGWFIYAVSIVFAVLDWRELRQRGIPRPFHWAWSFFVLAVGWPGVYMIGRAVVVKRRTGSGLAPLWIYVALQVVAFAVIATVSIIAFVEIISVITDGLSAAGNVL